MRPLFIHSLAVSVLGFLAASLVWGPMLSQATTLNPFSECHIPSNVPIPCPSVTYSDGSTCTTGGTVGVFGYCRGTCIRCLWCIPNCQCQGLDSSGAPCCTLEGCK